MTFKNWIRLCRIAGYIGLVSLLFAIFLTGYNSWDATGSAPACHTKDSDWLAKDAARPSVPTIVRVDPEGFQFRHQVCVVVVNLVAQAKIDQADSDVATAKAGDTVDLPLDERAKAKLTLAQAEEARKRIDDGAEYRLYLNGSRSGLTAQAHGTPDAQGLIFKIEPEEDASTTNGKFWRELLGGVKANGKLPVIVGIGPADGTSATITADALLNDKGNASRINFVVYTPIVFWTALIGIVGIVLGIGGISYDTPLLREGTGNTSAYSLSRVQMAFWLVLATSGFLYIWLVTGQNSHVFPESLFVLIGISGATATAAQALDKSPTAPQSESFFKDITGAWQGGEMQLHRLQIITWTIILGLIFLWDVVANLVLTDFDTNLLILTGVVNGVYVSLKTQEPNLTPGNGSAPAVVQAPPAAPPPAVVPPAAVVPPSAVPPTSAGSG